MVSHSRNILATIALPYANGSIHLGHLVEAIQADIWVRFQKMQENTCWFICGNDAHGTPIMLSAQRHGINPEEFIKVIYQEHKKDYHDFLIQFDLFSSTHSKENQYFAEIIYHRLYEANAIISRKITQYYDQTAEMFLPDRFIKGTCPKCSAEDQYGDSCEVCGATYHPTDLLDPTSAITGTIPILKETEHYFFDLPRYTEALREWMQSGTLQDEITNKLQEWFAAGLQAWDITRDAPYFGFPIPEHSDKYFYVWMDAPIGYISIFKQLCGIRGDIDFDKFWRAESETELYHFIGKDIMYFHTLFWPAMLMGAQFRTPTSIFTHGFLTIDGQKMSKSRGTFIKARTYLAHLKPEYLRYYFAAKLTQHVEDIDLNWEDFMQRVNADLVGKVINIASRCAMFINKYFHNMLSAECIAPELFEDFILAGNSIALCYENREFSRAVREIMQLADRANQYIDEQKPWALLKESGNEEFVQEICSMGLNLFLLIMKYLKPILPEIATAVETFFNIAPLNWNNCSKPLVNHQIQQFMPLIQRITKDDIEKIKTSAELDIEKNDIQLVETANPEIVQTENIEMQDNISNIEPIFPQINYDDFAKLDLRIAKISNAESVEGAEKLLKLTLDIGCEKRQVFAGIKSAYAPEELIGRYTVMVANLAPRKMRFGVSEGMVLAAGPGGEDLWILFPDEGALPGMRVK